LSVVCRQAYVVIIIMMIIIIITIISMLVVREISGTDAIYLHGRSPRFCDKNLHEVEATVQ